MAPRADDRGPDGLRAQAVAGPTQLALPDGPAQAGADVAEGIRREVLWDAVCHAAGEGKGDFLFGSVQGQGTGALGGELPEQPSAWVSPAAASKAWARRAHSASMSA